MVDVDTATCSASNPNQFKNVFHDIVSIVSVKQTNDILCALLWYNVKARAAHVRFHPETMQTDNGCPAVSCKNMKRAVCRLCLSRAP